ncbi:hypothetical protein SAMN05444166_0799 [Singulisphaera sp. GP187]|uniref:hypothetical protein n=1 Tax=Singulisphaera sp. GP187 TaxID=1882752 RepID=UPI00092B39E4|nr:hypothetical protein [Singulisphaera sp. GP187]SIN77955.1 hypothetical protein SAMN05444166_0799 [Singulisphaera sp. GP187]
MANTPVPRMRRAVVLGAIAVSCVLLGLVAWCGYGVFATRGIHAAASGDPTAAGRMARYAGSFSLAQLSLGMIAVGMGWVAILRSGESELARRLGYFAIGLGFFVLLLLMALV